jgi:formylglycine-generating enzyme required for sulfatase activity
VGNHVFIGYAREDSEFVFKLATNLKARGVPIWLDQWDIPYGADWDQSIERALYACACFVIVLSPAAVASDEVRGELYTALEERKPIVPVLYQPCRIPRRLQLIQRVDFTTRSPDEEAALNRLVCDLRVSQPGPPASEKTESQEIGPIAASYPEQERRVTLINPLEPTISAGPKRGRSLYASQPEVRNSIGMEFVLIPAGEFLMGSNDGRADERPVHKVGISQPFYLGRYTVTQAQWEAVMGNNPSCVKSDPNRPVDNISWEEVQKFIQWLNAREDGKSYRLPTEAEWEYAARAGSSTAYCFGNDESRLGEYAWYEANAGGQTHPVGQLRPNAWGLYDIHGNVWEWVQDWYEEYPAEAVTDPQGPSSGSDRVHRGGSWCNYARLCRSAHCDFDTPGFRYSYLGFRLLRAAR